MIAIRKLSRGDARELRALRLEALKLNPEAFAASLEFEASKPLPFFEEWLLATTFFGGFQNELLAGCVSFRAFKAEKLKHKGVLSSMYVRPSARGSGMADQLVSMLLSHADGLVESVQLTVVQSNEGATRLYERHGFERYGVEPAALKFNGSYQDEILMRVVLNETSD